MTYRGQLFGKLAGKYVSLDMQSSDVDAKDARIAELEAHQECQMREEGALRDTIDGLKEELAAERDKVERLRFDLKDISGSIEYADATGQYEYTLRMCAGQADEALAATEPRDLTKPRNYGSIEVEGAKSD